MIYNTLLHKHIHLEMKIKINTKRNFIILNVLIFLKKKKKKNTRLMLILLLNLKLQKLSKSEEALNLDRRQAKPAFPPDNNSWFHRARKQYEDSTMTP